MGFPFLLTRKTPLLLDTKDQCPAQVSTDSMPESPEEHNNRITSFPLTSVQITSQIKQRLEKQDLKCKPFVYFLKYYDPRLV